MTKKSPRIDVSADAEPLTNNPFAAFADKLPKDLAQQGAQPPKEEPRAEILSPDKLPYRVERTKKGAFDLAFERRAKGNGVTVLRRVHGDGEALMKKLKKKCGAGGTVHEDSIELQGNHRTAIERLLRDEGL